MNQPFGHIGSLFDDLLDQIIQNLQPDWAGVLFREPVGQTWGIQARGNLDLIHFGAHEGLDFESLIKAVVKQKTAILTTHPSSDFEGPYFWWPDDNILQGWQKDERVDIQSIPPRFVLCLPLLFRDKILGVVCVTSSINSIKTRISSKEERQQVERLIEPFLEPIYQLISVGPVQPDSVAPSADYLQSAISAVNAARGCVLLQFPDSHRTFFQASAGWNIEHISDFSSAMYRRIFDRVMTTRIGRLTTDIAEAEGIRFRRPYKCPPPASRYVCCVPLMLNNDCLGILCVDRLVADGALTAQDQETVENLAHTFMGQLFSSGF